MFYLGLKFGFGRAKVSGMRSRCGAMGSQTDSKVLSVQRYVENPMYDFFYPVINPEKTNCLLGLFMTIHLRGLKCIISPPGPSLLWRDGLQMKRTEYPQK